MRVLNIRIVAAGSDRPWSAQEMDTALGLIHIASRPDLLPDLDALACRSTRSANTHCAHLNEVRPLFNVTEVDLRFVVRFQAPSFFPLTGEILTW